MNWALSAVRVEESAVRTLLIMPFICLRMLSASEPPLIPDFILEMPWSISSFLDEKSEARSDRALAL